MSEEHLKREVEGYLKQGLLFLDAFANRSFQPHMYTYSTKYWVRIYRLNGSILSNLQTSRKRGTTTNGSYFQSICLLCNRFERFKWVIYRKRWITSRFHSKRRFFLGLFLNESEGYFIRKQLEEMFSMWWNKCLYVLEVSRWFLQQVELKLYKRT